MENQMSKEDLQKHLIHTQVCMHTHKHTCTQAWSIPMGTRLSSGTEGQKGSGRQPVCFSPCSQDRGAAEGGRGQLAGWTPTGGGTQVESTSMGNGATDTGLHSSFLCSTGTKWTSLLHQFWRRSLLVLFPNINQNLPDNSPCFYCLYKAMNELHSINRFEKLGYAFCKH